MTRGAIITHGGVGAPASHRDGCEAAAEAALRVLSRGALRAAVAGAVHLEDDPRFNAGTGSFLRLDGKTVQMDAAVMDSTGVLGAVAAIEAVKNPILVALEVSKTPHVLIAGTGAVAFARARGFKSFRRVTARARERYRQVVEAMRAGRKAEIPRSWWKYSIKGGWNFPRGIPAELAGCDTIGVVARDARGNFAVANSTGGASPMLYGRVGDSPLVGCGFYAGADGAVAATGQGEEIIRRLLCRTVYEWLADGVPAQDACERGVALIPKTFQVGLIAVGRKSAGAANNRDMPYAIR